MNVLPTRIIEVTAVSGSQAVTVNNLYMTFEITKALRSKPSVGKLRIFNLKPSTAKIIKGAESISIVSGYSVNKGLVYSGDVRRTSNRRRTKPGAASKRLFVKEGLDFITEVDLGGKFKTLTSAYFQRSYTGTVQLKQVITDALPTLDLNLSNLASITDETLEDFCWSGRTSDLLDDITRTRDFSWFEDNGVVFFHKVGEAIEILPVPVSESTGLIGTPEVTDRGVKFKALLNPAVRVGGLVNLTSSMNEEANGEWKVKRIVLRGDNREGEHSIECEAIKNVNR